jgi:hypothetical protein
VVVALLGCRTYIHVELGLTVAYRHGSKICTDGQESILKLVKDTKEKSGNVGYELH